MRRRAAVVAAAVLLLALPGCAPTGVEELLGGPQGDEDVVHAEHLSVRPESTRLLHETDELSVWAARSAESDGGLCVVLRESEGTVGTVAACTNSPDGPVTAGTQLHEVYLTSIDTERRPDWARSNAEHVAPYLWVSERLPAGSRG